jgi:hypothetical protein
MRDPFDPEVFRLPEFLPASRPVVSVVEAASKAHHPRGERFLAGPVPWSWLTVASRLPGQALQVGIVIWHMVGLTRTRTVRIPPKLLRECGVGRHAGYRALKALEAVRLVEQVVRSRGQAAVVTVRRLTAGEIP